MPRRICIALVCVALGWASNVNPVAAQPYENPAKTDKTEDLLSAGNRLREFGRAEGQPIPKLKQSSNQPSAKERAIQYRLKQPISLNFKDTPLREAIQTISIQSGIQVVPDLRALQEAKVNLDAPLSGGADNINMKNALNILLKPMRLTYIIEDDVLKITTEDRTISTPIRKIYKVADLVDPLPTVEGQQPRTTVEGELKELILNTIAKNSWEDMGGTGTIQYFPIEKALVVTHSQEIHEEIQLLLATLRKLQDLMVNVDVRFVHSSAEASQRLLNEMGQEDATRSVVMDSASIQRFLEAAKAQTIVAAPKINVYNGQRLAMSCVQKQIALTEFRAPVNEPTVAAIGRLSESRTDPPEVRDEKTTVLSQKEMTASGWRYDVQPTVAPDRKSVRLNLNFEHFVTEDAIERTTKAAASFTVPDQRTLIWRLGAAANGQHLFVLVTPRVIEREPEQEDVSLRNLPPIPGR